MEIKGLSLICTTSEFTIPRNTITHSFHKLKLKPGQRNPAAADTHCTQSQAQNKK